MPGGFQSEQDFQDFQKLNPAQQLKYLHATDPDFGKLPVEQQNKYVDSLLGKQEAAAPPKNYGFTPMNMLHGLGEGIGGMFKGGYEVGKDLSTNPNWIVGPNSTYDKFVGDPAAAEASKATALWNKGGIGNKVQAAGHELAGALPMVGPWAAHLGERAGTGDVGGAGAEAAGAIGMGYAIPKIRGAVRDQIYADMPPSGKGPQLTPFAKKGAQIGGGAAGAALAPGNLGYEGAVGGYLAGPELLKKAAGSPELGSIKNPGLYSKMPTRVKAAPVEAETAPTTEQSPAPQANPRARMGPPLRPNIFASPEDAQIYDAHIARLGAEAKDTGLYSAARGKVGRTPDYQERAGRALRDYGPPEDADAIARRKASSE